MNEEHNFEGSSKKMKLHHHSSPSPIIEDIPTTVNSIRSYLRSINTFFNNNNNQCRNNINEWMKYELTQMNMKLKEISEHLMSESNYPLGMHFVTRNQKYYIISPILINIFLL